MHRSPYFWDDPQEFEPERFLRAKSNDEVSGWDGFDPSKSQNSLYPTEVPGPLMDCYLPEMTFLTLFSPSPQSTADFAFLPFGGGPRKCVGDQFALMEATVALAMLLRRYDFQLAGSPEDVELVTGATIHTKNGLWCQVSKRQL